MSKQHVYKNSLPIVFIVVVAIIVTIILHKMVVNRLFVYMVDKDNTNAARILLSLGADANAKNEFGRTPLMFMNKDNDQLVELLLTSGARVNEKDSKGQTALYYAIIQCRLKFLKTLLKYRANVNIHDENLLPPLSYALTRKCTDWPLTCEDVGTSDQEVIEMNRLLLNNVNDVNLQIGDDPDYSSYLVAAISCMPELVPLLIAKGADVNLKVKWRGYYCTPLQYAVMYRRSPDLISLLIKNGADINASEGCGATALIISVITGQKELLATLLKNNADIHARDINGKTALARAIEQNSREFITLLQNAGAK